MTGRPPQADVLVPTVTGSVAVVMRGNMRNMDRLLTPNEVADVLQVPAGTLPQWRYLGRGPRYVKIGRHVRYRPTDVEHWIEEQASRVGPYIQRPSRR